jgi:uncharacterized protein YjbJ (UPF0337 family)
MSSAERARNRADKLAGRAKEKIGRATGNQRMENEGRAHRLTAGLRAAANELKDAFRR